MEQIRTKVTAAPMPMPFIASVVSASVGQVPSTSLSVGLEVITPSMAIFLKFVFISDSLPPEIEQNGIHGIVHGVGRHRRARNDIFYVGII